MEFCGCSTRSHRCVVPFYIYRDCEDSTLLNFIQILQTRSTGKGYLILVLKSASIIISFAFERFSLLKVLLWRRSLWSRPSEDQREPYSYNDNSNNPCVMSFSIFQHCCVWSSPSSFSHFQPKSDWKFVAALRKIRVVPHNYLRVSARNNHRFSRKKLSFCVMYRMYETTYMPADSL